MLIPDCVTHKSASETVNSASPALQGSSLYTTNNTTGTGSPYQQHKVISTSSHTHPAFTINTWTLHITHFTSSFHLMFPTFTSQLICWSCNLDFHRQHKDTTHSTLSVDPVILTFTVNTRTPHIPPYLLILWYLLWSSLSPSTQGHHAFCHIPWSCDLHGVCLPDLYSWVVTFCLVASFVSSKHILENIHWKYWECSLRVALAMLSAITYIKPCVCVRQREKWEGLHKCGFVHWLSNNVGNVLSRNKV